MATQSRIECVAVTAPYAWASALVNGDETGLGDSDASDFAAFQTYLTANGLFVVSIEDDSERFTWHGDLYHSSAMGVTVCTYICHRSIGPNG